MTTTPTTETQDTANELFELLKKTGLYNPEEHATASTVTLHDLKWGALSDTLDTVQDLIRDLTELLATADVLASRMTIPNDYKADEEMMGWTPEELALVQEYNGLCDICYKYDNTPAHIDRMTDIEEYMGW